jgi:hypothetical protein
MIVFGFSAYIQYSTLRFINPTLASSILVMAIPLSIGGLFLIVLPPAFMKLIKRETGLEHDETFPDEVTGLPDVSASPSVVSPQSSNEFRAVYTRTGDPSSLPEWIKTTHQGVGGLPSSNEHTKRLPRLSLEELIRRLKGLEIRVGKLRKRVLHVKAPYRVDHPDSFTIENEIRACLLEALEDQHAKGEISDEFYHRKRSQLKPAKD